MRISKALLVFASPFVALVALAGVSETAAQASYEMVQIPKETPAQKSLRLTAEYIASTSNTSGRKPDPVDIARQIVQRWYDNLRSRKAAGNKAAVTADDGALLSMSGGPVGSCQTSSSAVFEPSGRFLYLEGVCGFRIDPEVRALVAIDGSPFPNAPGTNGVGGVTVDPTGRYLFRVDEDADGVTVFRIDPVSGALSVVSGSPFATGVFPIAATVDASGRYLYVANNGSRVPSSISGYAIDTDTGALSPLPGSPYAVPSNALQITSDPIGKYVYLSGGKLQAYAIDAATGALSAIGAPIDKGGRGLAVDPSARYLYMAAFDGIAGYAIGADGALTSLGAAVPAGANPVGIAVSTSGRYVYASDLLGNTLWGYKIDWDTGALAPIGGSPFPTVETPFGIAAGGFMPDVDYADIGFPYSNRIAAYAGKAPYARAVIGGTLPPGLVLDAATGMIHGTATATGTYTFTVQVTDRIGQTATKGYAIVVSPNGQTPGTGNYQGLWWNSPAGSEAGWGINFAHQGDIIFATRFTYDASGKPLWLAAVLNKSAEGVYSGDVFTTTGPNLFAVPWDGSTVVETTVGSATVTFSGDSAATFDYTVNGTTQQKSITRQVFAGNGAAVCTWGGAPNLAQATNYQDLWWNAPQNSEPGWGVNFTHQGDIIFFTWFTYGADGKPRWLIAVAQKKAGTTNVYEGPISTVTGPAFSAVPWDPNTVVETIVGSTTITFADGNRASFAYTVDGVTQTKEITRQVFAPPGTVCQ